MFNNIFSSIAEKLSGLNPVKSFIKYALDKFLNELLNDEIKLQDFKNGCLNLTNIGFNADKINQKHLVSSPYIFHSGSIGFLKIQLPSLTEISSKSIEIEVKQIQLELKPNKNFYENFKERIKELQENMNFDYEENIPDQQISENNPMDFFKETLKQILLNIKIKVQDIVIKLYMNAPTASDSMFPNPQMNQTANTTATKQNKSNTANSNTPPKSSKNQYYLMLRVPMLIIHKNQDIKGKVKDLQEIKLDIEMPQLSMHLLRDHMIFPEFNNQQKEERKDQGLFPFKYPTIHHPSTILLFGLAQLEKSDLEKDKNIPRLIISITTDYKNKNRELKINAATPTIELMVNPIQIKIVSRFVFQIREFKNILDFVKSQLNMNSQQMSVPQSQQMSMRQSINMNSFKKSKSNSHSKNLDRSSYGGTDIFASIAMSIMDVSPPQQNSSRLRMSSSRIRGVGGQSNMVDEMVRQNSELNKSVSQFNQQFKNELKKQKKLQEVTQQITSELRVVNFEKKFEVQVEINQLYLYLLKYVHHKQHRRNWMHQYKTNLINESIPMSYFLFSIKTTNFHLTENGKNLLLSITKLKLQNVKLVQEKSQKLNESKEEFYDFRNSVDFYAIESFKSIGFNRQPSESKQTSPATVELIQFELKENDHFCVEQILGISQKPGQNFYSKNIRKYNFLPKPQEAEQSQYILYKPGIKLVLNSTGKTPLLKIDLEEVATCMNTQIIQEFIDIYFPLFAFKRLSEYIQLDFGKQKGSNSQQNLSSGNENNPQHTSKLTSKKRTLLQSQYSFNREFSVVEQYIQNKEKPVIKINIQQVNIGFYQSQEDKEQNLVQMFKKKSHDGEMVTQKKCFCKFNSQQIYLECFGIEIDKKQEDVKLGVKKIISGLIELKDSKIYQIKALFRVQSKQKRSLKLFYEKDRVKNVEHVSVYLPEVQLIIDQKSSLKLVSFIKHQLKKLQQIKSYALFLKNQNDLITQEVFNLQRNTGKKSTLKSDKVIEIYLHEARVSFLKIVLFIEHLFVQKHQNEIMLKLSTFVLASKRQMQVFLNQMKNQQLSLKEHIEKQSKYPYIKDSNIIVEISDQSMQNGKTIIQPFHSKNRVKFFNDLKTIRTSVLLLMNKSQSRMQSQWINNTQKNNGQGRQRLGGKLSTNKQKFEFAKKPPQQHSTNIAIEEEEQFKQIFIDISSDINVSLFNVLKLVQQKQRIENFVKDIQQHADEIIIQSNKTLTINERKISVDSDIENIEEMEIKLAPGKVNIDIRPSFLQKYKSDGKADKIQEVIFSNTRSFLSIEWEKCSTTIKKRTKFIDSQVLINVKYHFLEHDDRETTTNPILLRQKQLKSLGFLELFEIQKLKLTAFKTQANMMATVKISKIKYSSSISTISALQLHLEHLVKHNLEKNFGFTMKEDEEKFHVLEVEEEKNKHKNKDKGSGQISKRTVLKENAKQIKNDIKRESQPNNTGKLYTIKNNNKIQQFQPQNLLQSDQSSDQSIQDITNAYQKYTAKIQIKKQQEMTFKSKPFNPIKAPLKNQQFQVFIQNFSIQECKVKIYTGNDFQFINCESLHQSKQKKRTRLDCFELMKYIELRLDLLTMSVKVVDVKKLELESFLKIENLEINYSTKKKQRGFFKRLVAGNKNYTEQVLLPLLRSDGEVKILLEVSPSKVQVKFNKTSMNVGFTSEISELIDEANKASQLIELGGWKKVYNDKDKTDKQLSGELKNNTNQSIPDRLFLIIIPENKITLKLIFHDRQILSNQTLQISELVLHEQLKNQTRINQLIIKWAKKILLNNLSNVLGGTAVSFLGKVIEEILNLVKFVLGIFFKKSSNERDEILQNQK